MEKREPASEPPPGGWGVEKGLQSPPPPQPKYIFWEPCSTFLASLDTLFTPEVPWSAGVALSLL